MDEKHCEDHHQHHHQQQPTLINPHQNLHQQSYKYVCIKQKNICVLLNNLDKISALFDAKLVHVGGFHVQNGKKFVTFQAIPFSADSDPTLVAYNIQVIYKRN